MVPSRRGGFLVRAGNYIGNLAKNNEPVQRAVARRHATKRASKTRVSAARAAKATAALGQAAAAAEAPLRREALPAWVPVARPVSALSASAWRRASCGSLFWTSAAARRAPIA